MAAKKTHRNTEARPGSSAGAASDAEEPRLPKSIFREYAETIIICVMAVIFFQGFVVMRSKVPTTSMLDTLLVGDYILINRNLFGSADAPPKRWLGQREIRRGDVIVFQSVEDPEVDLVKRVIGLPGETIQLVGNQIFIDGDPLNETYVIRENNRRRSDMPPQLIPEDSYFMMGDNRDSSRDSRYWGPVPRPLIKGRAFFIWWSYEEQKNDHLNTGLKRIASIAKKIPRLPLHTRWRRLFSRIR